MIPAGNHSIEVFRDDRVVGGFHNGGKTQHRLFIALAIGDIEMAAEHAHRLARGITQHIGFRVNPAIRAVLAAKAELDFMPTAWGRDVRVKLANAPLTSAGCKRLPFLEAVGQLA